MGATAGDLLAARTVGAWLDAAGIAHDVAVSEALADHVPDGVRWDDVPADGYTDVAVVCGPVGDAPPLTDLLTRFAGARRWALDVTMLQRRDEWDPFDAWWARDGDPAVEPRPDLALAAPGEPAPVVALVLAHDQQEYAERRHAEVHAVVRSVLSDADVAVVEVDTCFDPANATGLRTAAQVEGVLRAVDVVVTTRLHGLVLGLRNGTPVLAVDPVAGGAKVAAQAEALGWPEVLRPEEVDVASVRAALQRMLAGERDADIERCRRHGLARIEQVRAEVLDALAAEVVAGG
ncbi:MAG TPA: polysaccharide pyruvyl transferase family protein [Acidimicrobiales bacterium]|nr:polysaccharide pyruvyl transferase family protein [Acidimicrobiales bacterium]